MTYHLENIVKELVSKVWIIFKFFYENRWLWQIFFKKKFGFGIKLLGDFLFYILFFSQRESLRSTYVLTIYAQDTFFIWSMKRSV